MSRAGTSNTWDDPRIVDDPRIPHTSPAVREAAEAIHRNESMHRHDHHGVTCVYCSLNAARALGALKPRSDSVSPPTPVPIQGEEAREGLAEEWRRRGRGIIALHGGRSEFARGMGEALSVCADELDAAQPEPFFAIRLAGGEDFLYGEYAWMKCDGPDDWTVPDISEHDRPTTYEIVNMRPIIVATRTFGELDEDDDE